MAEPQDLLERHLYENTVLLNKIATKLERVKEAYKDLFLRKGLAKRPIREYTEKLKTLKASLEKQDELVKNLYQGIEERKIREKQEEGMRTVYRSDLSDTTGSGKRKNSKSIEKLLLKTMGRQ